MLAFPGGPPWYLPFQAGHTLFKAAAWSEERDRGELLKLAGRKKSRIQGGGREESTWTS